MPEPLTFEAIQQEFDAAIAPVVNDAYAEMAEVWNTLDDQFTLELRRQLVVLQPTAMRILRKLEQHAGDALTEMQYASLPLIVQFDQELGHTAP